MASKILRWSVGFAGGAWGCSVGLAASFLFAIIVTGGNPFLILFALLLVVPLGITGTVCGVFGALRLLSFIKSCGLTHFKVGQAALVALGIPLAIAGVFLSAINPLHTPSDDALIADFYRHENDLNQLVGVIKADKVVQMDAAGPIQQEPKTKAISSTRAASCRQRLVRIGILAGFDASTNRDEISFHNWASGLSVSGGEAKGFVLLTQRPKELTPILDGCFTEGIKYRRIKGNWFLYYLRD